MTSRLYATTRRLFKQVSQTLQKLGLGSVMSPLTYAMLAIYVTGLILLDRRQNGTRIARWLPGRMHDGLNRLLRCHELSTRAVMKTCIKWAKRIGTGHASLDDVIVEKAFSKKCAWMGWTYSNALKRKVYGFHVVLLMWSSGPWRIPVAFRIWRPSKSCGPKNYRKKTDLALAMLIEVIQERLPMEYVVMDFGYSAGWLTKKMTKLGLTWGGVLHPKTTIHYRNRRWSAKTLSAWLKLKWRKQLGLRARSIVAYSPKYGTVRLVVTRNRHGNFEVLVTNDLGADLTTIVLRKRSRWAVETLFRDAKQFAGLAACQCRVDQALVRHVAFVLLAFIVLQRLRLHLKETLGEVKERLQLEAFTGGLPRPLPLKGKVALNQLTA